MKKFANLSLGWQVLICSPAIVLLYYTIFTIKDPSMRPVILNEKNINIAKDDAPRTFKRLEDKVNTAREQMIYWDEECKLQSHGYNCEIAKDAKKEYRDAKREFRRFQRDAVRRYRLK